MSAHIICVDGIKTVYKEIEGRSNRIPGNRIWGKSGNLNSNNRIHIMLSNVHNIRMYGVTSYITCLFLAVN